MNVEAVIGVIYFLIILVFILWLIRRFGAWMMRIDEVIELEREILAELKKGNRINERLIK